MSEIINLLASLVTILMFVWAGTAVLIGGLKTEVPAWLLLATAVAAFLSGFLLSKLLKSTSSLQAAALKKIHEIRFDYLPDSPTKKGWTLGVENKDQLAPEFLAATDSPVPGSLLVKDRGRYYLDCEIEPHGRMADRVEFYAKFTNNSAFYLKVKLGSRDGSKTYIAWLAHVAGTGLPSRFNKEEWTVYVAGEVLVHGWMRFSLSMAPEVERTYGQEGWVYQELMGIRLRGSISLSPILFHSLERQQRV